MVNGGLGPFVSLDSRGGLQTFAAGARATAVHFGSGHSAEYPGRHSPDRHDGRKLDYHCNDREKQRNAR